ncbi:MAG: NUDIX hydrolase [Anaerolineae bacterium]
MKPNVIRPIAVCIFRRGDSIFVFEGYDPTKEQVFYRPLGGAIEFGESGAQTVARELQEEIGAQITEIRYLFTLENIFTYDGQPGHEIIMVYEGRFVNDDWYDRSHVKGHEDNGLPFKALWKPLEDFRQGAILYPTGLLARLIGED